MLLCYRPQPGVRSQLTAGSDRCKSAQGRADAPGSWRFSCLSSRSFRVSLVSHWSAGGGASRTLCCCACGFAAFSGAKQRSQHRNHIATTAPEQASLHLSGCKPPKCRATFARAYTVLPVCGKARCNFALLGKDQLCAIASAVHRWSCTADNVCRQKK